MFIDARLIFPRRGKKERVAAQNFPHIQKENKTTTRSNKMKQFNKC